MKRTFGYATILAVVMTTPAFSGDIPGPTYLDKLESVANWLEGVQNTNVLSPDYGAVSVNEGQSDYYQSDAGIAVLIWSRMKTRTNATRYDDNIAAAWAYHSGIAVGTRGPQYQMTIDSNGVIRGELAYRRATGDTSFVALANEHANWLIANRLNPAIRRNIVSEGIASGAAYLFAVDQGDSALAASANAIGQFVRGEIENDPTLLSDRSIEIHGSGAFSGVLESVFIDDYGNRQNWAATYAPFLPTTVPSGGFQYTFQSYLAGAFHAAWEATADTSHLAQALSLIPQMNAEDDDQDGGIPKNSARPSTEDDSWTTGNLGHYLFDRLPDLDLSASPDNVSVVAPGDIVFDFGAANHLAQQSTFFLVIFLKVPSGQQLFLAVTTLTLPGGFQLSFSDIPLKISSGTPTGRYELKVQSYGLNGSLLDTVTFPYDVF